MTEPQESAVLAALPKWINSTENGKIWTLEKGLRYNTFKSNTHIAACAAWTKAFVLWDQCLPGSHPDCVCPCLWVCRSEVALPSPLSSPPYTPGWHHPPSTGPTSSQLDFRTSWMHMVWAITGRWTQVRNTWIPVPGLPKPKWRPLGSHQPETDWEIRTVFSADKNWHCLVYKHGFSQVQNLAFSPQWLVLAGITNNTKIEWETNGEVADLRKRLKLTRWI